MYIPENYKNENQEEIKSFLKANAFGILVTNKDGKSLATHIPLEFSEKEDGAAVLHGHISKANAQCDHLESNTEVLCIFNGPNSYVSSSWYDFEEVSTWNYVAVHVRGTLNILDQDALYQSLKSLMGKYEEGQENPVDIDTLSPKTMTQIHGIIGFEITINWMEAAYKLSQNRDDKNHNTIIKKLKETGNSGSIAIAEEMDKNRKPTS